MPCGSLVVVLTPTYIKCWRLAARQVIHFRLTRIRTSKLLGSKVFIIFGRLKIYIGHSATNIGRIFARQVTGTQLDKNQCEIISHKYPTETKPITRNSLIFSRTHVNCKVNSPAVTPCFVIQPLNTCAVMGM